MQFNAEGSRKRWRLLTAVRDLMARTTGRKLHGSQIRVALYRLGLPSEHESLLRPSVPRMPSSTA